jgi:hypothetical protein
LLSIIHVLDPKQQGITKKHSEAIAKYLVSASLADTDDKREKRLFELEYGADALAEIENEEARANLDVDEVKDYDDDDDSDGSAGSLKDFVVEEEEEDDDDDDDEVEDEGDEVEDDDEEVDDDDEVEDDDEEQEEEEEDEDGVITTIVEGPILDVAEDRQEDSALPAAKRAKTATTGDEA